MHLCVCAYSYNFYSSPTPIRICLYRVGDTVGIQTLVEGKVLDFNGAGVLGTVLRARVRGAVNRKLHGEKGRERKIKGREEGRAGVSKKTSGTHPTHVSTQTTKAICNASLSLEASRRGAGRFFVWPSASFCLSIYAREEVCFSMSLLLPW